ncbi:MAG: class I SAM-dependent methyltransferase [Anaerolineales bacterium]|nr:class I SAM-dependent methyltransferase [Anaerolineales bacterium]
MSTLFALRKRFTAPEAGALLSLAQARRQAVGKFPAASNLYFTPEAVEQATAMAIAAHRAAWIDRCAAPGVILDLGCGIGGDLIALAQKRRVIAYELDPVRSLRCRNSGVGVGRSRGGALRRLGGSHA